MALRRIPLADDDDAVCDMLQQALERDGFDVVSASCASEALGRNVGQEFDVLLSNLYMPDAGDGFTVVSAMHHTHPHAVTLILNGYPALEEAMSTIFLQADEGLVKPIPIDTLRNAIQSKLATHTVCRFPATKSAAPILENDLENTIQYWMTLVENDDELTCVRLSFQERTGHLTQLLCDLIYRPANSRAVTAAPFSIAAREHGNSAVNKATRRQLWSRSRESCRSVFLQQYKTVCAALISVGCFQML